MEVSNSYQSRNATAVVTMRARRWKETLCMHKALLVTLTASVLSTGAVASAPAAGRSRWTRRPSARSNRNSAGLWNWPTNTISRLCMRCFGNRPRPYWWLRARSSPRETGPAFWG